MSKPILMFWTALISFSTNQLTAQWLQTNGPGGGEAFCLTSIDTMLFVGTEDGIYRSDDDGSSWKHCGPKTIVRALSSTSAGVSGNYLFAGTYNGGVYLSTDQGDTWKQVNFGLLNHSILCLAANDSTLFAGTAEGVFRTPSDGAYWIPSSSGLSSKSIRSLAVDDQKLYAGTDKGLFLSTDNGTHWTAAGLAGEAVNTFAQIGTNFFAGTDTSGAFISTDGGANWRVITIPDMGKRVVSLAVLDNSLFAATEWGVYRTPGSGDYWIPVNTGLPNYNVYTLYVKGRELFAGTICGVFRSWNYGENWTEVNDGILTTKVHALISSGDNLYAGVWGGIYESSDKGTSWKPLTRGSACFALAIGEGCLYAGGGGHVGCYDFINHSWEWVPAGKSWIRTLAISGTTLFAGTEGSGAFRITRHAPGWWTIMRTTFPDTMVYALAVTDSFVFAGSAGGVYRSSNMGISWDAINEGLENLSVTALAVKGSRLYAGTQGGGVFVSADEGTHWTSLNDGLVGLARDVLCFAFNEGHLFAGSWRGGVHLLNDDGSAWMTVNTGLMESDTEPASVVHGLALSGGDLFAGTRGAGVWRRPLAEMMTPVNRLSAEPHLAFSLHQNYPNPFNCTTTIEFSLAHSEQVSVSVYSILGELVERLIDEKKVAGTHKVIFNASNRPNGIYYYGLEAGGFREIRKAILLK